MYGTHKLLRSISLSLRVWGLLFPSILLSPPCWCTVLLHLWLQFSITDLSILRINEQVFGPSPWVSRLYTFSLLFTRSDLVIIGAFSAPFSPSVSPSCGFVWLLCGVSAPQANYPCRASWLFYESSYLERASPTRAVTGLWVLIFVSFNIIISLFLIFYYF